MNTQTFRIDYDHLLLEMKKVLNTYLICDLSDIVVNYSKLTLNELLYDFFEGYELHLCRINEDILSNPLPLKIAGIDFPSVPLHSHAYAKDWPSNKLVKYILKKRKQVLKKSEKFYLGFTCECFLNDSYFKHNFWPYENVKRINVCLSNDVNKVLFSCETTFQGLCGRAFHVLDDHLSN